MKCYQILQGKKKNVSRLHLKKKMISSTLDTDLSTTAIMDPAAGTAQRISSSNNVTIQDYDW